MVTKNNYLILALIPARGGSKGVPKKNIKLLDSKPLIYYTIKSAQKSKFLNRIVVSTEDEQIEKIVKSYGIEVIKRPRKLAKDDTPSIDVFNHSLFYLEKFHNFFPDIVVILQPTSPLRNTLDIDNAIKKFLKEKPDSVVSMSEVIHSPFWMYTITDDKPKNILKKPKSAHRRQDSPKYFQINGAVYVTWKNLIRKKNTIFGTKIRSYIMPQERSVDIDTPLEFILAEALIKKANNP